MPHAAHLGYLLIGLLVLAFGTFLTRAIRFARLEYARVQPVYPAMWTAAQCRALEYFRLLVGLALASLWASFLFSAPSMQINFWSSQYLVVFSLILLLLISNAWLLLLVPRDWQTLGTISGSFWVMITFLVVWWGVTFTATGWMIAAFSASPPLSSYSGIYAAQGALMSFPAT